MTSRASALTDPRRSSHTLSAEVSLRRCATTFPTRRRLPSAIRTTHPSCARSREGSGCPPSTSNRFSKMAAPIRWRDIRVLTFDCYGTLIDWETGILAVLRPWARANGLAATDEDLLAAHRTA